ncbi:MAG: ABC transporter ATP-binding protein [Armatimonadota bacterium]|nr:ABC transporter ATP-binding protein [Armatimonadota bacterium]
MPKPYYDDEVLGKAFDPKLTRKMLVFLRPYKSQLVIATLTVLMTSGLGLIIPKLWKAAIDEGISAKNLRVLEIVAILYVVTYLVRWLASYWQTLSVSRLGQSVLHDIRHRLFSHIQNMSLSFFDRREVGRLIARLTSDVEAVNELLTSGTLSIIADVGMLIGIIIILVRENLQLSLMTFSLVPFMWIVTSVFRTKARIAYRDVRQKVATVTATVAENVSGVRVVKSFSREKENLRRFKQVNLENRRAFMNAARVHATFVPIISVLSMVAVCMVYWYGGLRVAAGVLTIGILVEFVQYMNQFFQPIRDLSNLYHTMQSAMAGAERIFEILETKPDVYDKPNCIEMPPIRGDVEFRHVNFAYDETLVLKDVSFYVKAGQTVAFVGPTGAGKTTIINLLSRQYDVTDGAILIDGIDIRSVSMRSLRKQMGVVLQDPFLFPGSIKENIRYGRLDATDQEVEAAAKTVGAHDFIIEMPRGYDTDVREGGSKLSAGQKQLISFARALLADPRILILDEATSSVDTQTEMLIQQALRQLLKGRTSFVIAHRLSTIIEADIIMVIEDGRVQEVGTHEELLSLGGLYKRLYDMQFEEIVAEEEIKS